MHAYPKVITVTPLAHSRLRITFDNGVCKSSMTASLCCRSLSLRHWCRKCRLFRTVPKEWRLRSELERGDRLGGVVGSGARHRA